MSEMKHSHPQNGDPNGGNVYQGHRPYWTRAHRDWRVWVGVVLMIACMIIYLMTGDLSWRPRLQQPQPPLSGATGK
jgi:cytochrome c-type biogenesis protein CcmH/NrfG